jgi:putative transposase
MTRNARDSRYRRHRFPAEVITIHDPIADLFHIPRHDISSAHHRELRNTAKQMWSDIARLQAV